jgi:tetratricopeptide (TPR) repeat protein
MQLEQRDLAGALASYRASRGIVQELAADDPGDIELQRDLSIGYANIGDVLMAQGNLSAAAESYKANLAIAARYAAAYPNDALWQRHVSISYRVLGSVRKAQGNIVSALANYDASLPLAERLAALDSDNAQWQADLAAGLYEIATVATGARRTDAIGRALQIVDELKRRNALPPEQAAWPEKLRQMLAAVPGVTSSSAAVP